MKPDFRGIARQSLRRAKAELDSGDDKRLRYAALELRDAIEALTFDRAQAYARDFPPSEYGTWQPRKVLQALLSIDPGADTGAALSIGIEETPGVAATNMQSLGKEHVLSMRVIKEHYDALGNCLHVPTLKQLEAGHQTNSTRLRQRCNQVASEIETALTSPVFNLRIGFDLTFQCLRCERPVGKTMPAGAAVVEVSCFHCNAKYELRGSADSTETQCAPKVRDVRCYGEGCDGVVAMWADEIKPGTIWLCPSCGRRRQIVLAVSDAEKSNEASSGETEAREKQ